MQGILALLVKGLSYLTVEVPGQSVRFLYIGIQLMAVEIIVCLGNRHNELVRRKTALDTQSASYGHYS